MPAELRDLDFAVEDELDGKPLTPHNVSLPILRGFLDEVETFVKGDLLGLTLAESKASIHEGSLKVKVAVGADLFFRIQNDLEKLKETGDLDLIQAKRSVVVEKWQSRARKTPKRNYWIGGGGSVIVQISSQSRFEHKNEKDWVAVEKYFTGKVFNAGGKQEPNVHIQLDNGETLRIDATERQLSGATENVLFKAMTLRVRAEQHLRTKALRKLHLMEFLPAPTEVDEEVLAALWKKGAKAWKGVESATEWVEQLRGNR